MNCDPHADFRRLEGRHSGNGFSQAFEEGLLGAYYVFGLHESYNSKEMLGRLDKAGFRCKSFESLLTRGQCSFEEGLAEVNAYLNSAGFPVGIELDLDSIAAMPSSARSPVGFSLSDAARFLHGIAGAQNNVQYLHLPEGAPALGEDGERMVGRALAYLVCTYLKAGMVLE